MSASIRSQVRAVGVAVLLAAVVAGVVSPVWIVLLSTNIRVLPQVPWAPVVMVAFLAAYWRYLSGRGRPARTQAARARLLRARRVPPAVLGWSLAAGSLGLVALVGLWVVLVRLTGYRGNPTEAAFAGYPLYFVLPLVVAGSLVSPLSEEAAFRGYAQVVLERTLHPWAAVAVSSLLFALWHGPTQGFVWSKLVFYFAVGLLFGTIACLSQSTLPALPVHIAGDILFFTLVWPRDALLTVVWTHGFDAPFWLSVAQALVFGGLTVWALWKLARQPGYAVAAAVAAPIRS